MSSIEIIVFVSFSSIAFGLLVGRCIREMGR